MEGSSRNSSSMAVKMLSRGARGPTGLGQTIVVNIPYIRSDIPILVLFRALGFVADKDILEHVVYNFEDVEMMEALRPSIEEAFPVQDQQVVSSQSSAVQFEKIATTNKEFMAYGICGGYMRCAKGNMIYGSSSDLVTDLRSQKTMI